MTMTDELSLVVMSASHWFYRRRLWNLQPTSSPGGVLYLAHLIGSLGPSLVQCPACHLGLMHPAVLTPTAIQAAQQERDNCNFNLPPEG